MSTRFQTLLLREWIQHHRGWLILTLAPPLVALILLLLPFSTVDVGPMPALGVFVFATVAVTTVVLGIAVTSVLLQTPGLARRDRQDRSIEFWLSLPTGHGASIGATLLMHLLFVPLLALAIGALLSQPIGLTVLARAFGATSWFQLPWRTLVAADMAALLRAVLGVVLACFWILPLVMLTMAASAWLKRWGVPVLALALVLGHALLAHFYGITVVDDTVHGFLQNALRAVIHDLDNRNGPIDNAEVMRWLVGMPSWLFRDGLAAIADLAQPLTLVAAAISAACFWLLVLRRQRNG
jgi:hypothetical protein